MFCDNNWLSPDLPYIRASWDGFGERSRVHQPLGFWDTAHANVRVKLYVVMRVQPPPLGYKVKPCNVGLPTRLLYSKQMTMVMLIPRCKWVMSFVPKEGTEANNLLTFSREDSKVMPESGIEFPKGRTNLRIKHRQFLARG